LSAREQSFWHVDGQRRPDDYYEIEWKYERFAVTKETALEVVRRLAENPLPQWITFRDLTGAQHRIRASKISRISESTVAQRAAEREFHRLPQADDAHRHCGTRVGWHGTARERPCLPAQHRHESDAFRPERAPNYQFW
jgi:hypothetical protein